MSIDWKQVAKMNDMDFEDFKQEMIHATMSLMDMEMKKNESDTMIVTSYPLRLTCQKLNDDISKTRS